MMIIDNAVERRNEIKHFYKDRDITIRFIDVDGKAFINAGDFAVGMGIFTATREEGAKKYPMWSYLNRRVAQIYKDAEPLKGDHYISELLVVQYLTKFKPQKKSTKDFADFVASIFSGWEFREQEQPVQVAKKKKVARRAKFVSAQQPTPTAPVRERVISELEMNAIINMKLDILLTKLGVYS